jgi:hypothetical protein
MKKLYIIAVAGLLSCASAFAADNEKIAVTVVDNIPTTSQYNWDMAGQGHTSCYGSSCSSYYSPAQGGTAAANGAIVKLLLPGGRIVIAVCEMKPDNGRNVSLALMGAHVSPIYRDCRVPAPGSPVFAKFDKSNVKLFMRELSIDGTGKGYSETYKIRGILEPTPVVSTPAPSAPVQVQDPAPVVRPPAPPLPAQR